MYVLFLIFHISTLKKLAYEWIYCDNNEIGMAIRGTNVCRYIQLDIYNEANGKLWNNLYNLLQFSWLLKFITV